MAEKFVEKVSFEPGMK